MLQKPAFDDITVLDHVMHHQNGCIMLGLWNRLSDWLATGINTGVKILSLQTDFNMVGYCTSSTVWMILDSILIQGTMLGGLHRKMLRTGHQWAGSWCLLTTLHTSFYIIITIIIIAVFQEIAMHIVTLAEFEGNKKWQIQLTTHAYDNYERDFSILKSTKCTTLQRLFFPDSQKLESRCCFIASIIGTVRGQRVKLNGNKLYTKHP